MNVIKELHEYYSDLDRRFHFFFMELIRNPGRETIHDLRVNMKKQNAFFRLLSALDNDFIAEKATDAFAHFYKRAGKVRDLQVERQVVEAEEELLSLGRHLSLKLIRHEKMYLADLRRYEEEYSLEPIRALARVVKHHIQNLAVEEMAGRLEEYFGLLLDAIGRVSELALRREDELHNLRRRIKELFYNLELMDLLFPDANLLDTAEYQLLDELQSLLGDWHDYDFTIRKIGAEAGPDILSQMEEDRRSLVTRVKEHLPNLPEKLSPAEAQLREQIRSARFQRPPQRRPGIAREVQESFKQMNTGGRYM